MRTRPLNPRQLCLQLAARTLPGDHARQRHAERSIVHWNRKLEAKSKKKIQHKISSKFKIKYAHKSFASTSALAAISRSHTAV